MDKPPELLKFVDTDFTDPEVIERPNYRHRRATIVAELADNKNVTPVDIQKMIEAGLNVAKLRSSYCTREDRVQLLGKIDKAAANCSKKFGVTDCPVASCVTLRTCVTRTGLLAEDKPYITLKDNDEVILSCDIENYTKCTPSLIFVSNTYLPKDCKVGMEIVLNAGQIELECLEIVDDKTLRCIVKMGGILRNMSLVSVRGMVHSRPPLTNKDLEVIKFCLEQQVDMIVIHYVRRMETLYKVRECMSLMSKTLKRPLIISSICTHAGFDIIDELLRESDGLLLARELVQFELAKQYQFRLPQIQKYMAAKCKKAGKPMFLSGGVLQDLLENAVLNDGEVTDVANALLDGVTGFILTTCQNVDYTIVAINKLNDLCKSIEPLTFNMSDIRHMRYEARVPMTAADGAVLSCAVVAQQTQARLIIVPTVTGRTARALQHVRPNCVIITVSTNISVTRMLSIYRCVVPLVYKGPNHRQWHKRVEMRVEYALEYALKRSWIAQQEPYVTLERSCDTKCYCDMVRIWYMSIRKKLAVECPSDDDDDSAGKYTVATQDTVATGKDTAVAKDKVTAGKDTAVTQDKVAAGKVTAVTQDKVTAGKDTAITQDKVAAGKDTAVTQDKVAAAKNTAVTQDKVAAGKDTAVTQDKVTAGKDTAVTQDKVTAGKDTAVTQDKVAAGKDTAVTQDKVAAGKDTAVTQDKVAAE